MGHLATEFRHIARRLGRAPMFTGVTLLTLALGIGANTAIFSVINGVLLKPLPYPDVERLVGVWHTAPGIGLKLLNASPATHFTYREENRVFQDISLWTEGAYTVIGQAEPERVDGVAVTYNLLPILGVRPAIGRTFSSRDDEPNAPDTVILSYAYWQRKFGGDLSAVGRKLMISSLSREIIGVMPPEFRFLDRNPALLVPIGLDRSKVFFGNFSWQSIARLKPGVTLAQANADVARMLPLGLDKFPMPPGFSRKMMEDAKVGPNVMPLKEEVVGDVGKVLWVLMGTVGIVLLIACANVANLFLVRAEGRQKELAIREALGAGRGRIARELLTEALGLGLMGGLLGLGFAYGGLRLLIAMEPANLPRLHDVTIDLPVLVFALLVSLLAGGLFGLIPVLKMGNRQLGGVLKEGGRGSSDGKQRHRARNVLVVAQVALALVLLVSAGLMIRTFRAVQDVNPGFTRPEQVLTMRIAVPGTEKTPADDLARAHERILERIRQVPGVISAGVSSSVTMDGDNSNDPIFFEDFPIPDGQIPPLRRYKFISGKFLETMGAPLLAGRDFTWNDIYGNQGVVLVSENLARLHWKTPAEAIGKRIRESPQGLWRTIIGVVGNDRDNGVTNDPPTTVYWPLVVEKFWGRDRSGRSSVVYAIRSTRTGSPAFLNEVRAAVWSVNRNLPLANVRTLETVYRKSMARTSFALVMLAIASALALALGLVGIYGVVSYSVSQRTREIGIRIALGARDAEVRRLFVRNALGLAGIGILAGLVAAIALTRTMSTLLFGVKATDPVTYIAVSAVLVAATLVASYLPARRATVVDPVQALRSE